ncbi:MAG: hypothetical protein LBM93_04625 [Oscillospiraceae bacterium]|jgi:hypothetical protein|nr:hypothetical protein [Oscillospiraceae bacterium]
MIKKRLFSVFAALIMVGCFFTSFIGVSAEETFGVKVDSVKSDDKGNFTTNILLENIPETKIGFLQFVVEFDSEAIEITSITKGNSADTGASEKELELYPGLSALGADPCFNYVINGNEITFSWDTALGADYQISEDGIFAEISGKIKDFSFKETAIKFVESEDYTVFGYFPQEGVPELYTVVFTDGTVKLSGLWCDVTEDRKINLADAVALVKALNAGVSLDMDIADATLDGKIRLDDAIQIVKLLNQGYFSR